MPHVPGRRDATDRLELIELRHIGNGPPSVANVGIEQRPIHWTTTAKADLGLIRTGSVGREKPFCATGSGSPSYFPCRKNAIKSAISWRLMDCSSPSGMSDRPVERSSSISDRRMVSSIPSARRSFKVVAVSSASSPETTWPRVVASARVDVVGRDLAIGVQDVDQQGIGGAAGDARQDRGRRDGPGPGAGDRSGNSGRRRPRRDRSSRDELESGLIARQRLRPPGRGEPGEHGRRPVAASAASGRRSSASRVEASSSPGAIVDRSRALIERLPPARANRPGRTEAPGASRPRDPSNGRAPSRPVMAGRRDQRPARPPTGSQPAV